MRKRINVCRGLLTAAVVTMFPVVGVAQDRGGDIPRTQSGRPDLSGTYDPATLTPLERSERFGDTLVLTEEEAAAISGEERALVDARNAVSNPDREAPPVGGDGSPRAAGNVGGYNFFWIDRGTQGFKIDGQWRTSIITNPRNGRRPARTELGDDKQADRVRFRRENSGTAWWLESDLDAPGPYDNPEQRPLAERCLLGFGTVSGPPMLPVLYNNLKRIVQTDDHVLIFVEMVHDARIVRMNQEHAPPEIRQWMGDSVGRWEGDTLVVDTTNFNDTPALPLASRNLHVVERISRIDADTLLYQFTVDDPTIWTEPWSGEYVWPATASRVYEYACHEANYALGGILRGARLLEADARGESK